MKIRAECCDDGEEEIVIRYHSGSDTVRRVTTALESLLYSGREMVFRSSGTEYYLPLNSILFFESSDGKVYAHTIDKIFTADYKLFELERLLPTCFVRVSKSVILNVYKISSLYRELVGNGYVTFKESDKRAYFSRGYHRLLKDKIEEMRLIYEDSHPNENL